jgi:hypothetical protein
MEKLMVFMPCLTLRAAYIFNLLFRDIIGLAIVLTDQREDYLSYEGPCLEYTKKSSGKGIFFYSHDLLIEKSIQPQQISFFRFHDRPAFFQVDDDNSAFPFDVFAASFYLVTRYEEYLPFEPDRFGRFRASESIAASGDFMTIPIVNLWALDLKDCIRQVYPSLVFKEKKFRFVPTIDIDHAFAYKQRSFFRTVGGYARSVLGGKMDKVALRSKVLLGIDKDPYDQYDYIREIHEQSGLKPRYFILFADYGKDDNNVSLSGTTFKNLIHKLDQGGTIGIHPSLRSGRYPEVFESEINGLENILDHRLIISRQHFLKVSFPGTYTQLIKYGITDDYSLGYATNLGFRAGIADPFPFFNLVSNHQENLILHPVSLMDVTLKDYLNKSLEEAIVTARSFVDTIKAVNGEFVSVWHNESFDESGRWKGWRNVYQDLLAYTSGITKSE